MKKPAIIDVQKTDRIWHVWVGPFGMHWVWPDVWNSRPDVCWEWREPMS